MIRPQRRSFICGTSARVSAMQLSQVQLDDPVPVFVGDLVDRLRQIAAGIVHQNVDAAQSP